MSIPKIITIDGPAASGKTTLGRRLAEHFGYLFFDTGVIYRALTWLVLSHAIDIKNEKAISDLASNTYIDIRPASKQDGRIYDVWIGNKDVTWEIRNANVDNNVSIISAYPGVRQALSSHQRRIGLRGNVVMVGRDIGTVILPEADLKIFLEASLLERAKRRYNEYINKREDLDLDEIVRTMALRDEIDSTREIAPLKPAEDAIRINSDTLDQDQVFSYIINQIYKQTKGKDNIGR